MYLKVIGKPVTHLKSQAQHISAAYDPNTKLHVIECDADVITLGVAIGVLKKEFEDCLSGLEPELANRIRRVTEEVVKNG